MSCQTVSRESIAPNHQAPDFRS